MTKLTVEAVHAIANTALLKEDEVYGSKRLADGLAIIAKGLVNDYAFHPERVAAAKPQIDGLLAELPDAFHKTKGGGWSFLNACQDKHGNFWGQHRDIEALICLGIAVDSASWLLLDMKDVLPGGVPYFEVHPAA